MNNQGLEALAALASSVAASATTTTSPPSNSIDSTSQVGSSTRSPAGSTGSTMEMAAASNQVNDFTRAMQNAATLLQSTQNVTQQQWQQVLSAASGLVNTQPNYPATVNAAPISTQGNQLDPSTMLALQQQLSLYQRLLQNPSQTAANSNVNTVAQPSMSSVMDAATVMQLAMRPQGQVQYTPVPGKDDAKLSTLHLPIVVLSLLFSVLKSLPGSMGTLTDDGLPLHAPHDSDKCSPCH
jgi:hypothetical protein